MHDGDSRYNVVVLEDSPASPLAQVELAVMLNRLYERYGLRFVAVEGGTANLAEFDSDWLPATPLPGGAPIGPREDVAARLLGQGEISAAELLALVYGDLGVFAEPAPESKFTLPAGAVDSSHMSAIAEAAAPRAEIAACQRQHVQKPGEVFQCEYAALLNNPPSVEAMIRLLDDVQSNVAKSQADWSIRLQDISNLQVALGRLELLRNPTHDALNTATIAVASEFPGRPVGIVTGAANVQAVASALTDRGFSFAVVRPSSPAQGLANGALPPDAFWQRQRGKSVDPANAIGALLDGRTARPAPPEILASDSPIPFPLLPRVPPSPLPRAWFRGKAQLEIMTMLLTASVANGVPTVSLAAGVPPMRYATLADPRMSRDGDDLIFTAYVLDEDQHSVQLWVRARLTPGLPSATPGLEARLLRELAAVQSGQAETRAAGDVGLPIAHVSEDVRAKFATDPILILNTTLDD
jgi:hypothetical protein